ncbi:MAG: tetratricopeptide repeat protein [Proteobacteria bacterium]|nr:tetratricopeptide repeat protein [Pseudomonadota bacterium]MBS0572710.1 tetratricopeptide repeat protein [Pseudomonadota bacterium]
MRLTTALLSLTLTAAGPALADGAAGPYLAGRVASINSDYRAAADYFTRALVADPANDGIMASALLAEVGAGDFDKARAIAAALEQAGQKNGLADLVTLVGLARDGKFPEALEALDKGRSAGPLVDGLFRAWSLVGAGRMAEAGKAFDAVAKQKGLGTFAAYQKALALASVGDFGGADAILSGKDAESMRASRRSLLAHAEILSQLERDKDALALLDEAAGPAPDDQALADLRKRLAAGETVPFTLIRSPADGLAEVFLAVGSVLADASNGNGQDRGPPLDVLMFARAATYLRPDLSEAQLILAANLESQKQHDLAIAVYNQIDPAGPDHLAAELGRADALVAAGQIDAATAVLQDLAKAEPKRADVWASLGDIERRNQRFAEAAQAYTKALDLIGTPTANQWVLFYARGICFERLKQWDKAEPDFRKALALSPDQPAVLNYLGYSFLERKTNLDEAMVMIEKAAKAEPDDGAIADSLGWALYRMGKFPEAEAQMEKAIALMPNDPVVNDHLGDVYWMVGRKQEARFEWKRALSFKPDSEEDAKRIRRKLEVGLDAVLKGEGAPATAANTNDNG